LSANAPFCIGLAGPSCSGKTSIAHGLKALLSGEVAVFGTDSYYLDLSHLSFAQKTQINFDDPDVLDSGLLAQHLAALRRGQRIRQPVYDFATYSRVDCRHQVVEPCDFLVVEGLFTLHWPDVRQMFDIRVFISASDRTCLERRKSRDVRERGRTLESILAQYESTVRPGNERFILPSEAHADLVVSGDQPVDRSAEQIARLIRERSGNASRARLSF
jgi:uridine kinase